MTGYHQIPIGYNTFIQVTTASSRDVTAIKKAIKIFSLACKWSIEDRGMQKNYRLKPLIVPAIVAVGLTTEK